MTGFALRMTMAPRAVSPLFYQRGQIRREIEEAIERLVAMLDAIDSDPDLEDDGSAEPYLGWSDMEARYSAKPTDDREDDAGDNPEVDTDREPSLGWTKTMAWGNTRDLELSEAPA